MTAPAEDLDGLIPALREVADALGSFRLEHSGGDAGRRAWRARIRDYLVPRLLDPDSALVVAVVGGSGSGKSTLVNSVAAAAHQPLGPAAAHHQPPPGVERRGPAAHPGRLPLAPGRARARRRPGSARGPDPRGHPSAGGARRRRAAGGDRRSRGGGRLRVRVQRHPLRRRRRLGPHRPGGPAAAAHALRAQPAPGGAGDPAPAGGRLHPPAGGPRGAGRPGGGRGGRGGRGAHPAGDREGCRRSGSSGCARSWRRWPTRSRGGRRWPGWPGPPCASCARASTRCAPRWWTRRWPPWPRPTRSTPATGR